MEPTVLHSAEVDPAARLAAMHEADAMLARVSRLAALAGPATPQVARGSLLSRADAFARRPENRLVVTLAVTAFVLLLGLGVIAYVSVVSVNLTFQNRMMSAHALAGSQLRTLLRNETDSTQFAYDIGQALRRVDASAPSMGSDNGMAWSLAVSQLDEVARPGFGHPLAVSLAAAAGASPARCRRLVQNVPPAPLLTPPSPDFPGRRGLAWVDAQTAPRWAPVWTPGDEAALRQAGVARNGRLPDLFPQLGAPGRPARSIHCLSDDGGLLVDWTEGFSPSLVELRWYPDPATPSAWRVEVANNIPPAALPTPEQALASHRDDVWTAFWDAAEGPNNRILYKADGARRVFAFDVQGEPGSSFAYQAFAGVLAPRPIPKAAAAPPAEARCDYAASSVCNIETIFYGHPAIVQIEATPADASPEAAGGAGSKPRACARQEICSHDIRIVPKPDGAESPEHQIAWVSVNGHVSARIEAVRLERTPEASSESGDRPDLLRLDDATGQSWGLMVGRDAAERVIAATLAATGQPIEGRVSRLCRYLRCQSW
ncbi:hypothetical protein NK718_20040 [Alsobacter sp. SYSU M60028]|uniref:Uncharacterized protein n=1 Tax=Alsobacter ponti TaxID=2962936 RepID=A0ABT1LIV0_9HYPH|nr:hypothetical protein [Alsobacter ponti]MCP8940823.1 hypothetical protein [Alsobacter ponti]